MALQVRGSQPLHCVCVCLFSTIRALLVCRRSDSTDPHVLNPGLQDQNERTTLPHIPRDHLCSLRQSCSPGLLVLRFGHQYPSRLSATARRKCCRHRPDRNERLRRCLPHPDWCLRICDLGWSSCYVPLRLQPRTRLDGHNHVLHVQRVHLERHHRQSLEDVRSATRGGSQETGPWKS
jgi:hypothetical protein